MSENNAESGAMSFYNMKRAKGSLIPQPVSSKLRTESPQAPKVELPIASNPMKPRRTVAPETQAHSNVAMDYYTEQRIKGKVIPPPAGSELKSEKK